MSEKSSLAYAYHMGYDDALAKRKPDASKVYMLGRGECRMRLVYEEEDADGFIWPDHYECSVCGANVNGIMPNYDTEVPPRFCPNCGAKVVDPTTNDVEPTTSATDELRRLLDERGVEWAEYGDGYTLLRHGGREYTVQPNVCNRLIVTNLTPEQAIAATLGSCNCSNSERTGACKADETETISVRGDMLGNYYFDKHFTIHVMECSECGHTYEHVWGNYEYCPHCGRRVVEVDA